MHLKLISNKYLENPEVLLKNKQFIFLDKCKLDEIELIGEFLKECMMANVIPKFYDIIILPSISKSYFLGQLYKKYLN